LIVLCIDYTLQVSKHILLLNFHYYILSCDLETYHIIVHKV